MTERERFEAWAQSQGPNTMMGFGNYYLDDTAAAWKAWQAACPEGWQVVPNEPTHYQQNAGSVERYHKQGNCKDIYKSMLSAHHAPERRVDMEERKEMAYNALLCACAENIKRNRSNLPEHDKKWLLECVAGGDRRMLGSYGAMISEIRKHAALTDAQIKYRLGKDDRVISRASGAGTCKIWWPKGFHVDLGLSASSSGAL